MRSTPISTDGGYWRAVLAAVPWIEVARATGRRILSRPLRSRAASRASSTEIDAALRGLAGRPRIFGLASDDARSYDEALPGARTAALARAEAILRREIEVFGVTRWRGSRIDWHLDVRSGRRFDPSMLSSEIDLGAAGLDPRGAWELGRGAHLLELGVAARLSPDLARAAQAAVVAEIESFLDDNPLGRGIQWTSPLEASLRALHWLAALELVSSDGRSATFQRRLAGSLVEHGRFIAAHLEDWYLVPGNHLLGDWLGLLAIGVAIGDAAEAQRWRQNAVRELAREARRQVSRDGAFFEGSTAYHRFALELLLAADRLARAARLDLDLGEVLAGMFRFVAGYLGPDGEEPGFGDGDDGRVLPLAPRSPRRHDYLLSVGVVRCGDPTLKRAGVQFSAEALWLGGIDGYRRWRSLPEVEPPTKASFPDGGVHVLRGRHAQVALRAGGHGQRGLGGHSHNDQLALAVWLDGAPLVVDPGTFCYTADPVSRDHLRATAAHSTVLIDGDEQSPFFAGHPFALPDRAHGRLLALDDLGPPVPASRDRARSSDEARWSRVVAHHTGYRRLACRALHQREVLLDRDGDALVVSDLIRGDGEATVEARFALVAQEVRQGVAGQLDGWLRRGEELWGWAGNPPDPRDSVVAWRDGRPWAALVPLGDTHPPRLQSAWWSPRYGERRPATMVRFLRRGKLPMVLGVAIIRLEVTR